MGVALAKDGILAVQVGLRRLGDEELRAVGIGSGVGHGEPTRDIKGKAWNDFIGEVVAGVAGAVAAAIARPES